MRTAAGSSYIRCCGVADAGGQLNAQGAREEESRPITIGALSRATQIPVETLRTWERRYLSPVAIRKPSGHRLYPVAAIAHLRRVAQLLERGHRPAELLKLTIAQLDALLDAAEDSPLSARRAPVSHGPRDTAQALETMLRATTELDREALLSELQTHWARLGPLSFLETIAAPFLTALGDAWQDGRIQVRHEHFASSVIAHFLRAVREPFDARARGPRTIVASPPNEQHEGGLLMVSVLLALHGRRIIYLGADTPMAEIAAAARERHVEGVAISVSASAPAARTRRFLADLRRSLPRSVALWAGGSGLPSTVRGVERFDTLAQLDDRLRRR